MKPFSLSVIAGGLAGSEGHLNEDRILSYFLDLIPRDADIVSSGESREKSVSGDKDCGDPPVAKVDLVIRNVSETGGITYVYDHLH